MNKNRDDELSLRECQFNTWRYLINWLIQSVNIVSVFGTWIQFNLFLHLSKTSRHRWQEDLNQGHLKSSHFWQLSFAKWTPTQIQKQEKGYFQLLYYNSGQFHMFDLAESCTRCQIWNDSHTNSMKCYISVAE